MSKREYHKKPLSFQAQVDLLRSRGLSFREEEKAVAFLKVISYYRLSAYFVPYQQLKDKFDDRVTFEQIINTYDLDRELRLLVFDCIERIEVAIRTQFNYCMTDNYQDAHWHDNPKLFLSPYNNKIGKLVDPYNDFQSVISKAKTARRAEVFIRHYLSEYSKPSNPPSWMCMELLTLGELSYTYNGLKNNSDKKSIASFFDVHPKVFVSWLHALVYVRNLCAHHSRLWNRDLAIEPNLLLKPIGPWIGADFQNNKRVFYFICMLKYLLDRVSSGHHLKDKLTILFDKYKNVPIK